MKMQIKRLDDDFLMEAINDTNNSLLMDGSESIGGHHKGMRPMQLLLVSIGGCSAIDIISIFLLFGEFLIECKSSIEITFFNLI